MAYLQCLHPCSLSSQGGRGSGQIGCWSVMVTFGPDLFTASCSMSVACVELLWPCSQHMWNHGIGRNRLQVYPLRNRSQHNASVLTARVLKTVIKVLCCWDSCDQGCLSDHSNLDGLSTLLYLSSHGRRCSGLIRDWTTVLIILTVYVDRASTLLLGPCGWLVLNQCPGSFWA